MIKRYLVLAAAVLVIVLSVGCGRQNTKNDQPADVGNETLKVGVTVGSHAEVAKAAAKEAAKTGLKVQVVEYKDYLSPDKALAAGDIDLACYQNQPFLTNFNKKYKTDLVSIGRSLLVRMGIYSKKYHYLKTLPRGATIAIPGDPVNCARALLLLERAGLLHLKPGVGVKAEIDDILSNPRNLKFKKMEASQLTNSIDEVDAAAITMNFVVNSDLNVDRHCLFLEPRSGPLAIMVIAARKKDKDKKIYQKYLEAYQSDVIRIFIYDKYNGSIEPAF